MLFFQVAIGVGIVVSTIVGASESLTWLVSIGCAALVVPAALMFALVTGLPESPRWLVKHDRRKDACASLGRVRPDGSDLDAELDEISALVGAIGVGASMWVYAAFNVAAWLFVRARMPKAVRAQPRADRDGAARGTLQAERLRARHAAQGRRRRRPPRRLRPLHRRALGRGRARCERPTAAEGRGAAAAGAGTVAAMTLRPAPIVITEALTG